LCRGWDVKDCFGVDRGEVKGDHNDQGEPEEKNVAGFPEVRVL
jgi:hypothetical protein